MYYMTRTFDHAGYFETRMLLAILAIAIATFLWRRRGDQNYWIMLAAGVIFQGAIEWLLDIAGSRGPDYSLSFFTLDLRGFPAFVVQGFAEGGILSMMSYWFLDIVRRPSSERRWRGYLAMCVLVVVLASVVGLLARGQEITSPRPMFGLSPVALVFDFLFVASFVILWLKGNDGFHYLGLWYAGCFIYVVLTFSTLQVWGARVIGERAADGSFVVSSLSEQFWYMLYSHLFEVAGFKIHYFAIPFALGLLSLPRRSE
jgi:hypothetical protein